MSDPTKVSRRLVAVFAADVEGYSRLMGAGGLRGLLVYCVDYRCSHSIAISGDGWPGDFRLSDIEARFVCQASVWVKRRLYF